MDNSFLYYSAAEIDYRRTRATHPVRPRRRRTQRTSWQRRLRPEAPA